MIWRFVCKRSEPTIEWPFHIDHKKKKVLNKILGKTTYDKRYWVIVPNKIKDDRST